MKFSFDFANISDNLVEKFGDSIATSLGELEEHSNCKDYSHPHDFINFPSTTEYLRKAEEIKSKLGNDLKCIYVVGIGGANLGAQAITLALRYSVSKDCAKVLFIDSVDPYFFEHLKQGVQNFSRKEEFVVLIISKSGETIETITNAKMILSALEQKFESIEDRIVILSQENSQLFAKSSERVLKIPLKENISDRYSVFSIIGLLPLALGGMDIKSFLKGANDCTIASMKMDLVTNEVAVSAMKAFFWHQSGLNIRDFFVFMPELEHLGKWTRQLISESLGKGGKGFTPTVSIGTTDLHSVAQLYLEGPKDKYLTLVSIEKIFKTKIADSPIVDNIFTELSATSTAEVISNIYDSYKNSLVKNKIPFSEIVLDELSEYSLGYYMQFMMIETFLLSKLLDVNPFDQPAVEYYKSNARKKLGIK